MIVHELEPGAEIVDNIRRHFPYSSLRRFQGDMANIVYERLSTGCRDVVVEAPTGAGKTAAVWCAVKSFAEENGLRVLWLVRTASQVSKVAREIDASPIFGRRMLCINPLCSGLDQKRFNNACYALRIAGKCEHYPATASFSDVNIYSIHEAKELGIASSSCPYELLARSILGRDAVVATHRQLRFMELLLSRWACGRRDVILVVDEGHHILNQSISLTLDEVSLSTLEKAVDEARRYGFNDLAKRIEEALAWYCGVRLGDDALVDDLLPTASELIEAGREVQETQLKEGKSPSPYILALADFKLSIKGDKLLLSRRGSKRYLEAIGGLDSVEAFYGGWAATVTISATYDPALLESLVGRKLHVLRAGWPFEENSLRACIVAGISTKYDKRDDKMLSDVTWLLQVARQIASGGRTLFFLPSYEILQEVVGTVEAEPGLIVEHPGMNQEEVEDVSRKFLAKGGVLVSVFNSRLSEGLDLSANLVVLVGIPFTPPTSRTRLATQELARILGSEEKAVMHGTILPALNAAIQAAGRAVRGPEDRAIVLMCDDRYRRLVRFLPRWFRERVMETVGLSDVPILLESWRVMP